MHNGNVVWKVLARYIDCQCEWKSCWHEKREGGGRGGKMWKRWALINVRRTSCWIWHSLLKRSLSAAFSRYPFSLFHHLPCLFYSTSPSYITPISHFLHLTVFSKSHFFSRHLSRLSWEAHVHSIYHHLSKFIWSGGLISGLGCHCSDSSRTCSSSQKQRNTGQRFVIWPILWLREQVSSVELCREFAEFIKLLARVINV